MDQALLLQRQVERLERRLASAARIDRHYTWARLTVFLLGAALTWAAASLSRLFWWSLLGAQAGWITIFIAALLFALVVLLHRRFDQPLRSLQILRLLLLAISITN